MYKTRIILIPAFNIELIITACMCDQSLLMECKLYKWSVHRALKETA